jgi:hypothetical protein
MHNDLSARDDYEGFLERDLLILEGLSKQARNDAIAPLASLKGDLANHLRDGDYNGAVFGWKSLSQLAARFGIKQFLFRGHTEPQANLLPGIGRFEHYSKAAEVKLLRSFQLRCRPYIDHKPDGDLEWLAIGRHYGLPTRLLDWSESFLVAAMFACQNGGLNRGVRKSPEICAISGLKPLSTKNKNPFTLRSVHLYRPPHTDGRIPAQQGVFTVHPDPTASFSHPRLERWLIWTKGAFPIKGQLDVCGINESTLFPDMAGLASYLSWLHKWKITID